MAQVKKRILFATWAGEQNIESPYSGQYSSGDKIASRIIAEGLAKRGYEVHFFALSTQTENFEKNGVFVRHIQNPIKAPSSKWTPGQILNFTPQFFNFYKQSIIGLIKNLEIDLIMARTVHLSSTGAHEAAQFTGTPIISTLAERDFLLFFNLPNYPPEVPAGFDAGKYYLNYSEKKFPAFKPFNAEHKNRIRRLFENSSALLALSPHLIDDVKKVTHSPAPSFVIPDGVGKEFFSSFNVKPLRKKLGWENKKVVLCIARTSPYKRQELLVKAFPEVLKRHPDAFLVIAGTGPYLSSLKKLIQKLKLQNKVKLLGYVPHEQVANLTKAADIIASPTDSEGLPLTLLEAMAAAKPVVASRVEPYLHMIQSGKTGLVVANKPKAFASAIRQLLSNPGLMNKIGKNEKKYAAQYSWERTIKMTEVIVKKVLK